MKKGIKRVYFLELVLLIFIIIFKIFVINKCPGDLIINSIFWIIFSIVSFIILGFPKDNNYLKKSSTRIVIIILLTYFLTIYLLGFFVGYSKGLFINFISLLGNIYPYVLFYGLMEINRYMILKKNANFLQIIILTIEFIILDIIIGINGVDLSTYSRIFIASCTIILPTIAKHCVCSYVTYNVSYLPSLVYALFIELYVYFMPILPSLGNYLTAVFGIVVPYFIYNEVRKNIDYKEKYFAVGRKTLRNSLIVICVTFLGILVALVSGFFKYQIIAIVSNSMNPVYYRGDSVIINKKDPSDIQEGEILAFRVSTGIVTHRVIKIINNNGKYTFVTKGDNNKEKDTYDVSNENVIGTVDYVLKYAGYPTVWLSGIFERS